MTTEEKVIAIVEQAGAAVLEMEKQFDIIAKAGAQNYVTTVDLRIQRLIGSQLEALCPDAVLIAEEEGLGRARTADRYFVLDPIDGTSNLMHGMRHSAISLSMHEGAQYVLGVIFDPYMGELFVANREGAFLNGAPIHVSERPLADALIAFGTNPYDRHNAHVNFVALEELFYQCHEIRRSGAASLDFAYIACGRLDGSFEQNLQAWDFSAGRYLIEQAGGRMSDYDLNPPCPVRESSIIASNGIIHEQIQQIVTKGR